MQSHCTQQSCKEYLWTLYKPVSLYLKEHFMRFFWCKVSVTQTHQKHGRVKQEKEGTPCFPERRKSIDQKLISAI